MQYARCRKRRTPGKEKDDRPQDDIERSGQNVRNIESGGSSKTKGHRFDVHSVEYELQQSAIARQVERAIRQSARRTSAEGIAMLNVCTPGYESNSQSRRFRHLPLCMRADAEDISLQIPIFLVDRATGLVPQDERVAVAYMGCAFNLQNRERFPEFWRDISVLPDRTVSVSETDLCNVPC